jgi:hypothetical protein
MNSQSDISGTSKLSCLLTPYQVHGNLVYLRLEVQLSSRLESNQTCLNRFVAIEIKTKRICFLENPAKLPNQAEISAWVFLPTTAKSGTL